MKRSGWYVVKRSKEKAIKSGGTWKGIVVDNRSGFRFMREREDRNMLTGAREWSEPSAV